MESKQRAVRSARREVWWGWFWICVGIGLCYFGYAIRNLEDSRDLRIAIVVTGLVLGLFSCWFGCLSISVGRHSIRYAIRDLDEERARQQKPPPYVPYGHGHEVGDMNELWWKWNHLYEHFPDWRYIADNCTRAGVELYWWDFDDNYPGGTARRGTNPEIRLNYRIQASWGDEAVAGVLVHESVHIGLNTLDEDICREWQSRAQEAWRNSW